MIRFLLLVALICRLGVACCICRPVSVVLFVLRVSTMSMEWTLGGVLGLGVLLDLRHARPAMRVTNVICNMLRVSCSIHAEDGHFWHRPRPSSSHHVGWLAWHRPVDILCMLIYFA